MILGFKDQFVEPILNGTKIHTIRTDPHCRWKAGRKIHGATGVRTKQYNQFFESECTSVQKIAIRRSFKKAICEGHIKYKYSELLVIIYDLDGLFLASKDQIELLAKNDGFNSVEAFFEWFDEPFVGKIIHWTDFKYERDY